MNKKYVAYVVGYTYHISIYNIIDPETNRVTLESDNTFLTKEDFEEAVVRYKIKNIFWHEYSLQVHIINNKIYYTI